MKYKLFFLLLLVSGIVSAQTRLGEFKISGPNDEKWNINEAIKNYGLPGLSVAIIDNYEIVDVMQWGVKEIGKPESVDVETAFSTASISKAITATIIVQLAHQGYLDLDEPINNYLKRWKLMDNEFTSKQAVTFRYLLSHSAGTSQHGYSDFYLGDEIPTVIESLEGKLPRYDKPVSVTFEPGTDFKYSGGGYTVAMIALEDIMNKTLPELAVEYIFNPLGMTRSTFYQYGQSQFIDNVAKAHNKVQEVLGIPICPQLSASGLWSTPTDMATFLIEIQKARLGKGKVLSKAAVDEMLTVHSHFIGFIDWRLGWEIKGYGNTEWFEHGGANTGIGGSISATMENGRGFAIFGNGPNSVRIPVINKFRDQLIQEYGWKIDLNKKVKEVSLSQIPKEWIGRYSTPFGAFKITEMDSNLVLSFGPNEQNQLIHVGNNNFMADGLSFGFTFLKNDKDGKQYVCVTGNGRTSPTFNFAKISNSLISPMEFYELHGYEKAILNFKESRELELIEPELEEPQLNNYGYKLISDGEIDKAIEIFLIMVQLYPDSSNAFDSLGEAYFEKGNFELSYVNYTKSLELNENNSNAQKQLERINDIKLKNSK